MSDKNDIKDGVSLRVSPEVLVAKAEALLKDMVLLKGALELVEQKIDGSSAYWNGEAGDQYRQIYNEQREDIIEIMNRLQNNPAQLKEIGESYIETDKEAKEIAEDLLGNVII